MTASWAASGTTRTSPTAASTRRASSTDADGHPSKARLINDVKVAKDEFELDYVNNPQGFSWKLAAPTKVQKFQEGSWTVVDKGGKSEATFALTLETSLPLPGFVQKKTLKDTLKGATSALAKQF